MGGFEAGVIGFDFLSLGMIQPERFFADGDGAEKKRLGFGRFAFGDEQPGESIETDRQIGMIRLKRLFADAEGATIKPLGGGEITLSFE